MKRKSFTNTAVAMLMTSCMTAGIALADTEIPDAKAIVSGEVNVGVQLKELDGFDQKFQEYRDIEQGPLLHDLRLRYDSLTNPYYLDLKVKNPVQDNEFYRLNGGSHGKFNFGLSYDVIPHNFSTGKFLLNDLGGGRYAAPDVIQQQLQGNEVLRSQRLQYDPATPGLTYIPFNGNPLGTTSTAGGAFINPADAQNMALDANMTGIVNNLYNSAETVKLGLKRQKFGFSFDYAPLEDVKVWTKVTNEKKTGARRISQGTYERYNNGANGLTHVVDYFQVAGIELPEAIDYRTTTFNVGTGIYKKNWMADAEYTFTNFDNKIQSLIWDNPFRATSAQATNADNTAGNPFNRGRSALGQLTLSPDSQSHDLAVSGSVELPLHSRFTGTISYGWVTQDDTFNSYTLNTAIVANSVTGTPAAASLALPQSSLNGKVATLSQSYQLTSKPVEPLAVTAKYRYYNYDNTSDHVAFPGYAAFGDSFWRTERNDVSGGQDAPVTNDTLGYTRQNAELSVDYHLLKPLTVSVEGFWEGWDREELRIDGTTELGAGAGFIYKPARTAKVKGSYRYAHRTVDGYKAGNTKENPEAIGLVNYDWADRVRHKADLKLQVSPIAPLSVALSGQYLDDKYGKDNRFGLKKNEIATGAIDVSFAATDAFSVYANYAREYRKAKMQSAAKDDVFNSSSAIDDAFTTGAAGGNFNPLNYWNSDITEDVDTVGLGANYQVIPEKLTLNVGYNFSFSKMKFNNYNPNGAVKLANATAQAWPAITNRYQEVKTDIGYNFTKNVKAGVTYLYELFMQNNWTNTPAYMAGSSFENSTKYLAMGANQFSYDAHLVGAYLNYKF